MRTGLDRLLETSDTRTVEEELIWYGHTAQLGPPILFLHGGLGESGVFAPMIECLAPAYQIWVYDRPGHGRSPASDAPITYDRMLEQLIDFIGSRIGTPVHIVGHSDGANLGLLLALHRPDLVNSLSMFSGNLSPEQVDLSDLNVEELTDWFAQSLENIAPGHAADAFDTVKKIVRLWADEPRISTEKLSGLNIPVLVASAELDMISAQHTSHIAAAIPGAVSALVSDATHMLISERPDTCAVLVQRVLSKAGASTARADAR